MKIKILIYGAGAIGRGFLGYKFSSQRYELSFVDKNKELINKLNKNKKYQVACIRKKKYIKKNIYLKNAFYIEDRIPIKDFDVIFSCVGPSQCYEIANKLSEAKLVLSCENDISTVEGIKKLSGNQNVFFCIPDVITSNTASPKLLKKDSLTIVTEDGELILQNHAKLSFLKEATKVSYKLFMMHWYSKFFIHNSPHAMLAYLGAIKKYKYIHQAMKNKKISKIIRGSMNEITSALIKTKMVSKKFATYYKEKELNRFSNALLYDPISRVAREPVRKLSPNNRIILSLRLALFNSNLPTNIAIGVKAALQYFNKNDEESKYLKNLKNSLSEREILKKISGIQKSDPLNNFCTSQNLKKII